MEKKNINCKFTYKCGICGKEYNNVLDRAKCEIACAEKAEEEAKKAAEAKKKEYNELFCNPYNAASYGYIDDVIEPRNTRFRVIRALEQLAEKKQENPWKKHDNLPL